MGDHMVAFQKDSLHETVCVPDNQGIPTIDGGGTVYATSGHNGKIYSLRDANGNGIIEHREISIFDTSSAFLNGPSIAPGLFVFGSCWSPMYVFRYGSS